jgi:hypothetical protein
MAKDLPATPNDIWKVWCYSYERDERKSEITSKVTEK